MISNLIELEAAHTTTYIKWGFKMKCVIFVCVIDLPVLGNQTEQQTEFK